MQDCKSSNPAVMAQHSGLDKVASLQPDPRVIYPSAAADITSGGHAPLVAVMKSTDVGQRDNLGCGRRSRRDRSPVRCVLA